MSIRKEKENDFFVEHIETFRKLGLPDPFFTIKTAFFQKGKYGRQVQFFQWELEKGEDIYVEFYDNVTDHNNKIVDVKPMNADRQLFKYKANKYFAEEYEKKENTNSQGEPYFTYTVPVSELLAILKDGSEITYALYEKRKTQQPELVEDGLPRLQKTLTPSLFPDFEQEFPSKPVEVPTFELNAEQSKPEVQIDDENVLASEMTLRDFAAIMLMKPVSVRPWLNDLIKQTKSEI